MSNTTAQSDADDASKRQSSSGGTAILWQELSAQLGRAIDDVDMAAAAARVNAEREAHPGDTTEALIERLIRNKCVKTGTVGAATSGVAIIPGIGTVASLTVGVAADIGATFKLQAELVLEIAAAHERMLTDEEKHTIVLVITGISSGANQALSAVGKRATIKITGRYAQKWVTHALPFFGVAASAAINALTTYLVGKRADAYFRLGPDAVGDWAEIWRALTGVDERAVGTWFAEQANSSWSAVRSGTSSTAAALAGAGKTVAGAVSSAGGAAFSKAGELAGAIGEGTTNTAGRAADAAASAGQTVSSAATSAQRVVEGSVRGTAQRLNSLLKRKTSANQQPEAPTETSDEA
ncbi:MAG TPA: hypothetical protein VFO07_01650 [Roseiflexaceae bacterium]|nr:hypothetical protein [Roseiflexaceae bacterium]